MKNLISLLLLLGTVTYCSTAQISVLEIGNLEMVKDPKVRKKLTQKWEQINRKTINNTAPYLIKETENTIYFGTTSNSVAPKANKEVYAFDKETLKAKFAINPDISINKNLIHQAILGDDLYLFFLNAERVEGKKGYTVRVSYTKNDEPEKYYDDYEETSSRNMSAFSNYYQFKEIVSSTSEKEFLFLETENGKDIKATIIDKNINAVAEHKISLPKAEKETVPMAGTVASIVYDTYYDDESQKIYFVDKEKNKDEKKPYLEFLVYDIKTKQLREEAVKIYYEDLGFYIRERNGYKKPPLVGYTFDKGYLYIYSASALEDKSDSKYKNIETMAWLHKFSFETMKIVQSSNQRVPEELFQQLKDSNSDFHKNSDVQSISLELDNEDNIKFLKIQFYTGITRSNGSTGFLDVGSALFPVENDEVQFPIAIFSSLDKKDCWYNYGKNYQMSMEKSVFTLSEIFDNQKQTVFSEKLDNYIYTDELVGTSNDYAYFKSKKGLVRLKLSSGS